MQVSEYEIAAITQDVWRAFIGLEVNGPLPPDALGWDSHAACGARISITGAWQGEVVLDCSPVLAGEAAAQVYAVSPDCVDGQMMCEVLAELANQIGGNLKSLLPEGCQLSLPQASRGRPSAGLAAGQAPSERPDAIHQLVTFEHAGHRFDVAVVGHA